MGYLVTKSTPDIECYGVYVLNLQTNKIEKLLRLLRCLQQAATAGVPHHHQPGPLPQAMEGNGTVQRRIEKHGVHTVSSHGFVGEPGVRGQSFWSTEAVRGDGGILRNHKGEAFMER